MFCGNCGNQIPDGSANCPICGTAQTPAAAPYAQPVAGPVATSSSAATLATVCGVLSIVVAILGGILFGAIAALIGLALGVVALVMGIKAKKETNNMKGNAGFVCGIIGLVFGVIFAAGCAICGCTTPGNYTCYGCIGGSCKASCDLKNASNKLNGDLMDLYDELEGYNW